MALISTEGPSFVVRAEGETVQVDETTGQPTAAVEAEADVALIGPGSQLLAFVLGRAPLASLDLRGDEDLAGAFHRAFPAP